MLARAVVLVAAVGGGAFGLLRGTWAVGGSDSSCYALMADAFAHGDVRSLRPRSRSRRRGPMRSRTFAPGGSSRRRWARRGVADLHAGIRAAARTVARSRAGPTRFSA